MAGPFRPSAPWQPEQLSAQSESKSVTSVGRDVAVLFARSARQRVAGQREGREQRDEEKTRPHRASSASGFGSEIPAASMPARAAKGARCAMATGSMRPIT